ncbi:VanZ family protein [Waterburya agarophytonicola K14]|uniref:VanZ family protein n=1 Tax=Waterburya agarophytonicola KI4 TaxID=2874699 RepID=A0A964FFF4_9CYAN|nr:VanZ family protein [Waterburya agarophytonicola]MCC0175769.1 VanZ family protein [Waterburya agarophytonicola KI4]
MKLFIQLLISIQKYWISLTLFILTIITLLSLSPLDELPPIPGTDKTHHFIAYAALMFPTAIKKPNYILAIALFLIAWSGAIELLQPYVNRYGDPRDLLANIMGLFCSWAIVNLMRKFFPIDPDPK